MSKGKRYILVAILLIGVILAVSLVIASRVSSNERKDNEINSSIQGEIVEINNEIEKITTIDENGIKVNISSNINKEIKVEEFDLTNIKLVCEDNITKLSFDIMNNSNIDYPEGLDLTIKFLDNNGNVINTLNALSSTLSANSTSNINASITGDYSDANDIEIVVNR